MPLGPTLLDQLRHYWKHYHPTHWLFPSKLLEMPLSSSAIHVGLDALTDTTVASAMCNSMFADLVSVAGHIYKHGVSGESMDTPPTISMHADEFIPLLVSAPSTPSI